MKVKSYAHKMSAPSEKYLGKGQFIPTTSYTENNIQYFYRGTKKELSGKKRPNSMMASGKLNSTCNA